MYHFEPSITIENGYVSGTTNLTDKLDALSGWNWTLGINGQTARNYKTVSALKAAVADLQEKDIAPNTLPQTSTIQLGWIWAFDNEGLSTWDASDTELGNLIASGQLTGMKVTLNLNAYQCQGGCTTSYKPIVTSVGGTNVTFLPAYSGSTPGCKFYTKSGDTYTEIFSSGTMNELAATISAVGAQNVYTDAKNTTFYGTIDKTWDETFTVTSSGEYSNGLTESMKTILRGGQEAGDYIYKTVYFENNDDTSPTVKGNWNANDQAISQKTMPDLNGVGYGGFSNAYQSESLLSDQAWYPWSSHTINNEKESYIWYDDSNEWNPIPRNDKENPAAVVLSRTF